MPDATININAVDRTAAGFSSADRRLKQFSQSATNTTKGLLGTITGAGLGSALGAALGINLKSISDSVARMLTGVTADAEKALARLVTASDKTAEITLRRIRNARTDQQQIVYLVDQERKLREQIEGIETTKQRRVVIGGGMGGVTTATQNVIDDEAVARRAELELQLNQIIEERDGLNAKEAAKIEALAAQLRTVEEQAGKALAPLYGQTLKGKEALDALRGSMSRVQSELAQMEGMDSEEMLLRRIELNKELATVGAQLFVAEQRALEAQKEAAQILGQGFEEAIVSGSKLTDVIKQIGLDLAKLALRNMVTNPLIGALSGSSFLGSIFGGFRASGGPVSGGKAYVVGEKGPELFAPSGAGSIIPNHAIGGAGGGGGNTYYIDARGADRAGFEQLKQMIKETRDSIKPIALASVFNASRRGQV